MNDQDPNAFPGAVMSLVRLAGGMVGMWLINKGVLNADQASAIGGAFLALAVAIWGVYSKYRANNKLKAAIAAPAGQAK